MTGILKTGKKMIDTIPNFWKWIQMLINKGLLFLTCLKEINSIKNLLTNANLCRKTQVLSHLTTEEMCNQVWHQIRFYKANFSQMLRLFKKMKVTLQQLIIWLWFPSHYLVVCQQHDFKEENMDLRPKSAIINRAT